ncbi:MAG: hypothetical protein ACTSXQ_03420 [Alphaproteobacteria bacterium]
MTIDSSFQKKIRPEEAVFASKVFDAAVDFYEIAKNEYNASRFSKEHRLGYTAEEFPAFIVRKFKSDYLLSSQGHPIDRNESAIEVVKNIVNIIIQKREYELFLENSDAKPFILHIGNSK